MRNAFDRREDRAVRLPWFRFASLGLGIWLAGLATPACPIVRAAHENGRAEESPGSEAGDSAPVQADWETVARKSLDLGEFHIEELRPTRNETIDVRFSLHLVLAGNVSSRALDALQHWRQRLREQVITVVRLTETVDFAEPQLARMRQLLLRRINRVMPVVRVESLYFTEFAANQP